MSYDLISSEENHMIYIVSYINYHIYQGSFIDEWQGFLSIIDKEDQAMYLKLAVG